nr:Hypothetical protein SC2p1_00250 [Methylocystis sp. SC2]
MRTSGFIVTDDRHEPNDPEAAARGCTSLKSSFPQPDRFNQER